MNCPGCHAPMQAIDLGGHGGTTLTIDLCTACHAFWFDTYESLRLTPASTLKLFGQIGEATTQTKPPIPPAPQCPRCRSRLLVTHDRQRDTPFEYWRCDHKHGRFITFFNFLREKSFIKTLSASERDELRQHIQFVNCSNCGGPIDLMHASACGHCGSPVSMLDMKQAGRLIEQLKDASADKPIDPALPLNLLRARRDTEAAFSRLEGDQWWRDVSSSGLVEAGIASLVRLLKS